MKRCCTCKAEKPLDAFTPSNARCKQCTKLHNHAHYEANKARIREKNDAWDRDNPERSKAYHREYAAKWYVENEATVRARSRSWRMENNARNRAFNAAWKAENKHLVASYTAKRRLLLRKAMPAWADVKAIKLVYERASASGMEVDHIVPLVSPIVCGLHVAANLQLLDRVANASKSNRHWPDMP